MSEDLGQRYVNALDFLISTKPESKDNYESPIITEQSDPDLNCYDSELNSMLETITHVINSEYRYRNSSEVFIPPFEFKDVDLNQKVFYLQELTQALSAFLISGKFVKPVFESKGDENEIEMPKPRTRKDVITKLINCQEGVTLTSDDLRQLSALLVGSTRDGARGLLEKKASVTKEKLEQKKHEFKSITEENEKITINLEKLNLENSRLVKDVKKYKQQISMLEKELVLSKGKCDKLTLQCNCLREDLIFERKKIQDMISQTSGDIDLRLSSNKH